MGRLVRVAGATLPVQVGAPFGTHPCSAPIPLSSHCATVWRARNGRDASESPCTSSFHIAVGQLKGVLPPPEAPWPGWMGFFHVSMRTGCARPHLCILADTAELATCTMSLLHDPPQHPRGLCTPTDSYTRSRIHTSCAYQLCRGRGRACTFIFLDLRLLLCRCLWLRRA